LDDSELVFKVKKTLQMDRLILSVWTYLVDNFINTIRAYVL